MLHIKYFVFVYCSINNIVLYQNVFFLFPPLSSYLLSLFTFCPHALLFFLSPFFPTRFHSSSFNCFDFSSFLPTVFLPFSFLALISSCSLSFSYCLFLFWLVFYPSCVPSPPLTLPSLLRMCTLLSPLALLRSADQRNASHF